MHGNFITIKIFHHRTLQEKQVFHTRIIIVMDEIYHQRLIQSDKVQIKLDQSIYLDPYYLSEKLYIFLKRLNTVMLLNCYVNITDFSEYFFNEIFSSFTIFFDVFQIDPILTSSKKLIVKLEKISLKKCRTKT